MAGSDITIGAAIDITNSGSRYKSGRNIFFETEKYESLLLNGEIRSCFSARETFSLDVNSALLLCAVIKARDVVINVHGENGRVLFQRHNEMHPWICAESITLFGKGSVDLRDVMCNCPVFVRGEIEVLHPINAGFGKTTFDDIYRDMFSEVDFDDTFSEVDAARERFAEIDRQMKESFELSKRTEEFPDFDSKEQPMQDYGSLAEKIIQDSIAWARDRAAGLLSSPI
jgi:hypothetical protein